MESAGRSAVVGIFAERGWAERAIDELEHAGFTEQQIGIVSPHGQVTEAKTPTGVLERHAAEGAVAGAVAGTSLGAIAGALATGLIPGIGPVLAGGLLLGILGGAAAGAAVGTFAGPFIALGFTEEEARHYEHALGEGRTVVVVRAADKAEEARAILARFGAQEGNTSAVR